MAFVILCLLATGQCLHRGLFNGPPNNAAILFFGASLWIKCSHFIVSKQLSMQGHTALKIAIGSELLYKKYDCFIRVSQLLILQIFYLFRYPMNLLVFDHTIHNIVVLWDYKVSPCSYFYIVMC